MAEEAEARIRSGPIRSPLRLGSMESTAGRRPRLPGILARFHNRWPDVAIELQTGTTASMTLRVVDYGLDLTFVGEPFSAVGLQLRAVFEEDFVLVTSRTDPPVKNASDLKCATILAFAQGCS